MRSTWQEETNNEKEFKRQLHLSLYSGRSLIRHITLRTRRRPWTGALSIEDSLLAVTAADHCELRPPRATISTVTMTSDLLPSEST
jgi:hypothetical protein